MKKFLVGVGNVVAVQNGQVVAHSKTMLNTGFEVSTSNTEIRGGQGNQLQYVYYHTGALSVNLEDTQWQLPWIMLNTGASLSTGGNFWAEETIVASGTTVQFEGVPVAVDGGTPYGYINYNGAVYNCPYDSTTGYLDISSVPAPANASLCVGYFVADANGETITIPANIIPDTVHLFIFGKLASDSAGSGLIGDAVVEFPLAQLTGAQTITMTADGYSTTPITAQALAFTDSTGGCSTGAYYAKISERITGESPLAGITALAIVGGDFEMTVGDTATLTVYAVKNGRSFLVDNSLLTFSSDQSAKLSVGAHTGVLTASDVYLPGVQIKASYSGIESTVIVVVNPS